MLHWLCETAGEMFSISLMLHWLCETAGGMFSISLMLHWLCETAGGMFSISYSCIHVSCGYIYKVSMCRPTGKLVSSSMRQTGLCHAVHFSHTIVE